MSVGADAIELTLTVNGQVVTQRIPARRLLVDFLRDHLGLTGTHIGCEHGICGACTVVIDGHPSRSCILLAAQLDGAEVTTIEGLTPPGSLSRMQRAFHEHHALQCGFCTPGLIATLATADPSHYPDDSSIRELLSGNLCRCTGYQHIVEAVRSAWGRPTDANQEESE